jgi:mevalonate kinase
MDFKFFPSKILLFGEYTVINGSDALAVPFDKFKGKWSFGADITRSILYNLAEFIKDHASAFQNSIFDHGSFLDDIGSGLFFNSNIPSGYGAGSSGALTAAIYDTYFIKKSGDLYELKSDLAAIENFFHLSSSGIDPLVSYTGKYVKITAGNKIEIEEPDKAAFSDYRFFLLDSGKPRQTKTFVDVYKQKMSNPNFLKSFIEPHSELSNSVTESFLKNKEKETFDFFKTISELQFREMSEMMLPELTDIWKNMIDSDDSAIKLCGAGGGGFYLIMTKSEFDPKDIVRDFRLVDIG